MSIPSQEASFSACENERMAELVRILSTPSVPEAEIVRSRLQDEGIPVMASGLDSPYRMGPVHLLVPAEFEVQARLVLSTATIAPLEDDRDVFEGGFAVDPDERG